MQTISYGSSPDQVGDLYLPDLRDSKPPVICLLHGGFWRMPWAREHIAPVAVDLARRGFAVWNLEYRRVGQTGGGWPGTLQDVRDGIDHLATLAANQAALDVNRGIRQLIIHGTHDADVPVEISRHYVAAAQAAGDEIRFVELECASHMDLVDPSSSAHAALCEWLSRAATITGVESLRT